MSASDDVLQILHEWATAVVASPESQIARIYLFGSLIHRDAKLFVPERSDVDLLGVISGDVSWPEKRIEATVRLARAKVDLESRLVNVLGRDPSVPIVSVVLTSPEDLAFGIHKDSDSYDFFGRNQFLPLNSDIAGKCTLPPLLLCQAEDSDLICAIRGAQKERNQYLALSADGSTQFQPWDENDPVPKELQRVAARVRYHVQGLNDDTLTDLVEGLEYLHDLVRQLPGDGTGAVGSTQRVSFAQLKIWLAIRRGARGTRSPMSQVTALTLWEILAETSYNTLRPRLSRPWQDAVRKAPPDPRDEGVRLCAQEKMASLEALALPPHSPGLQSPTWPLIQSTVSNLFVQGYPLILVATANEYTRLAEAMADETVKYLLWTINGSPLNVRGWLRDPDRLTSWDRLFQKRVCEKTRVVVFRSESERQEYIAPISEEHRERRANFEAACASGLRFTSADLLRQNFPRLDEGSRLDIGFVSTEPPHLPRLGICFYSPFATNDLGTPSVRCAQVVLFDTGKLVTPDSRRDHAEVAGLLERLQVHCDFIHAVRTGGWEVDDWLHSSADAVPALAG